MDLPPTRYEAVSRRAILKASIATGAAIMVPGLACASTDDEILSDAVAAPATTPTPSTQATMPTDNAVSADVATPTDVAVIGEMVISFTYTQAGEGLDERPYVAVWLEDISGDLVETVALWYEQGRRGERWLDHLTDWYNGNLANVAAGGVDDTTIISSATREPGTYDVLWDGAANGVAIAAGDYFVCIESAREEGPYSLIREPVTLAGSLAAIALAGQGELSAASVRIDA